MKKKNIILAALAGSLVLGAAIEPALAYFTTYAEAAGGYTVELGDRTQVEESFSSWTKHVVIASDADSEPVYIRAKAFGGGGYPLAYSSNPAGKWTEGEGGYWYYSDILYAGQKTDELLVEIKDVPGEVEPGDNFKVVVVYESTPVRYHEDGSPYADWSSVLVSNLKEGGA